MATRTSRFAFTAALTAITLAFGWFDSPALAQGILRGGVVAPGSRTIYVPPPPIGPGDFVCQFGANYAMVWDGVPGSLFLGPLTTTPNDGNGTLTVTTTTSTLTFDIRLWRTRRILF